MDLLTGCVAAAAVVGGLALAGYAVRRSADAAKALAETTARLAIRRPVMVIDQTNKDMALEHKAAQLKGDGEHVEVRRGAAGQPDLHGRSLVPLVPPPAFEDEMDGERMVGSVRG